MCNRYISPSQAEIERYWHIGRHNPTKWHEVVAPRRYGPFSRLGSAGDIELLSGQWGLIPNWSKTAKLQFSTNNCRSEEMATKPTFRGAWMNSQRCIIPALSFDEPCWETGKNAWWRFRRADGQPWGLAGLWNTWLDTRTGELIESYTMLTVNADDHPLMSRMHKPDPTLPPDQQDKRSVVAIEGADTEPWLAGDVTEAKMLIKPPEAELIASSPLTER